MNDSHWASRGHAAGAAAGAAPLAIGDTGFARGVVGRSSCFGTGTMGGGFGTGRRGLGGITGGCEVGGGESGGGGCEVAQRGGTTFGIAFTGTVPQVSVWDCAASSVSDCAAGSVWDCAASCWPGCASDSELTIVGATGDVAAAAMNLRRLFDLERALGGLRPSELNRSLR